MSQFSAKFRIAPLLIFVAVFMLPFRVGDTRINNDISLNTIFISTVRAQEPGVMKGSSDVAKVGSNLSPIKASLAPTGTQKDPTFFSRNDISVLQKLVARRELIDVRSEELALREGLLGAAEKRIDKKILELKKLITALEKTIKKKNK